MSDAPPYRALHWFALFTAANTLLLICAGGLVTSHGAGLAVPDWPNSFGYNMFLFPPSKWVGGIFYEHTHRLLGSWVGLLTCILAGWIWRKESRSWMKWLALAAVLGVVLQGVLGGLRVRLLQDELGIVHATLAQLFLVTVCLMALFTSGWFRNDQRPRLRSADRQVRWLVLGVTCTILLQLVVGAMMRHRHAGLAIPDFPLAHGQVYPDTSREALARYNRERDEVRALNPVTAYDVHLQMVHRGIAILIAVGVVATWKRVRRVFGQRSREAILASLWLGLLGLQITLGAFTVWSGKAADVATAHVAVGSLALAVGGLLTTMSFRAFQSRAEWVSAGSNRVGVGSSPLTVGSA